MMRAALNVYGLLKLLGAMQAQSKQVKQSRIVKMPAE